MTTAAEVKRMVQPLLSRHADLALVGRWIFVKPIEHFARAVLIGRAYAYGLGASGEAGVARAIEILRADLVRTLKLLGCPSVAALDRSYVERRD